MADEVHKADADEESSSRGPGLAGLAVAAAVATPLVAGLTMTEASAAVTNWTYSHEIASHYQDAHWGATGGYAVLPDTGSTLSQTTELTLYAGTTKVRFSFDTTNVVTWELTVLFTNEFFSGSTSDPFNQVFTLNAPLAETSEVFIKFRLAFQSAEIRNVLVRSEEVAP